MSACPRCGMQFSEAELEPASCPSCETGLGDGGGAGSNPFAGYFRTLWRVLTRPVEFFRSMPVSGGASGPLAFALVTHWMGAAVGFVWRLLLGGALSESVQRLVRVAGDIAEVDHPGRTARLMEIGEKVQHWFWGAGAVVADPFIALAKVLFVSFIVFIGARILVSPGGKPGREGAPREITFESALRIVCYGMAPSILWVLPIFGGMLGTLSVAIVTVIGAREVYRIGTGRALVVAMFPHVLLVGVLMAAFATMFVMVLKLVTSL